MRCRLSVVVVALGLTGGIAVVAAAQSTANGLPPYTDGYTTWKKLNRRPIKGGSPAHSGIKNVYASKPRAGRLFPNGTVIVKAVRTPGVKGLPTQVAVMRKVKSRWRWTEYSLAGSRYESLTFPDTVCTGCHMAVKSRDWVYTGR